MNSKKNLDYGEESIIAQSADGGTIQVRCPAHPAECDYVRVVVLDGEDVVERAYWNVDEWRGDEAEAMDTMGAIMGAIKEALEFEG